MRLKERVADYAWVVSSLVNRHPSLADLSEDLHVPSHGPTVVFLPGVGEGNEYLGELVAAFRTAGWNLRSGYIGGRTLAPVPVLARHIITALASYTGPVILVGHSKGGLVGRAILAAKTNATATLPHVAGLVTIATPWYGSVLARLFPSRSPVGTLVPGGVETLIPWHVETEKEIRHSITSINPSWDPHVPGNRNLLGATNVTTVLSGHFRVLGDPETLRVAVREASRLRHRWETTVTPPESSVR